MLMIIIYIILGVLAICAVIAILVLSAWALQYIIIAIPVVALIFFIILAAMKKKKEDDNKRYSEALMNDPWVKENSFQAIPCESSTGYVNDESKLLTDTYNERLTSINRILLLQDHLSCLSHKTSELRKIGYDQKAVLLDDDIKAVKKDLEQSWDEHSGTYGFIIPSFADLYRNTDDLLYLFRDLSLLINDLSSKDTYLYTKTCNDYWQIFEALFDAENFTPICGEQCFINLLPEYAVIKPFGTCPFMCVPYTRDMLYVSFDEQLKYDPKTDSGRVGIVYEDYKYLNKKKGHERREKNENYKDNPLIQRVDYIDLHFTYQNIEVVIPIADHDLGHKIEDAWNSFIDRYSKYYDHIEDAMYDNGVDYDSYKTFDDFIDSVNDLQTSKLFTEKNAVILNGELIQWNGKGASAKLILDDNVDSIGSAFKDNEHVEHISIEGPITKICSEAFKNCSALKTLTLPESISVIENNAFENCRRMNIDFSNNHLSSIGSQAFKNCNSLETVYLSQDTILGDYAFEGCSSLKNVIGIEFASLKEKTAFLGTPWLKNNTENGFIIEEGTLVSYTGSDQDILIPTGIKRIGHGAFLKNNSIRSVTIPDSVTRIDQLAFAHCKELQLVIVPNSVMRIEKDAFSGDELFTMQCDKNSYAATYARAHKNTIHLSANADSE